MKYRILGNSDLNVSVLAFGAWQLGDPDYWGEVDESNSIAAVNTALDSGINFFDTAEGYGSGESEKVLGRALNGHRDEAVIASKVSKTNCAPDKVRMSCEASLKRLGTDYIDLYQVHWPSREVPFEDTYRALVQLKKEGKIREIGVSNFGRIDLPAWLTTGDCVSNQVGYNLLFRAVEIDVVPICLEHNIGILTYVPLLQGLLAGKYDTIDDIPEARRRTRHFSSERSGTRHGEEGCEQLTFDTLAKIKRISEKVGITMAELSIAWLITRPAVTSVLVGARNPSQVERNATAADIELDDDTVNELNDVTEPLKNRLGNRIDLWESEQKTRAR